MNLKERAEKLKNDVPRVYLSLMDDATPLTAKIAAGIAVAYALSPIDLIPDFVPVLGYLDDLIILPFLVSVTVKLIPRDVWEKNVELSRDLWKDGKPEAWYYSIPVIIIWLLIIARAAEIFFL